MQILFFVSTLQSQKSHLHIGSRYYSLQILNSFFVFFGNAGDGNEVFLLFLLDMFFSKPRGPFKLDWVGENFFVDPCKHENRVLFLFITTHQLRFPPYKDLYISPPPMAHTTKKNPGN